MGVKEMNHDVSMLAWFKLLFGSVPTVNMIVTHDGSSSKKKKSSDASPKPGDDGSSSKKKKSSDASPKPGDDGYSSSDEFMPDKHGNLPWKKNQVRVLHQRQARKNQSRRNMLVRIVMMTLCSVSEKLYVVSYFMLC